MSWSAGSPHAPPVPASSVAHMLTDDQLAWVAFAEETRTVLLDEDSLPELNHHSQPYVLTVERFSGLALPPPLANIYHPPLQVVYSFRATLFDAATHAFFGSTFKSPPVAATGAANNNDDIKRFDPELNLYYHTRVADETCYMVVEAIATVTYREDASAAETKERSYSLGFSMLPVFNTPPTTLGDSTAGTRRTRKSKMYSGSPRVLQMERSGVSNLHVLPGAEIKWSLALHSPLIPVRRLLAENDIVSERDHVPGLYRHRETQTTALGDPTLLRTHTFHLLNIQVGLSRGFEATLLDAALSSWVRDEDVRHGFSGSASVVERRLRCNVHNGRTFVSQASSDKLKTTESGDLVIEGVLSFSGVAADPRFALICQLEYTVELPELPRPKRKLRGDVAPPRERVIALGWFPFILDGATASGHVDSFAFDLLTGPALSPFGDFVYDPIGASDGVSGPGASADPPHIELAFSLQAEAEPADWAARVHGSSQGGGDPRASAGGAAGPAAFDPAATPASRHEAPDPAPVQHGHGGSLELAGSRSLASGSRPPRHGSHPVSSGTVNDGPIDHGLASSALAYANDNDPAVGSAHSSLRASHHQHPPPRRGNHRVSARHPGPDDMGGSRSGSGGGGAAADADGTLQVSASIGTGSTRQPSHGAMPTPAPRRSHMTRAAETKLFQVNFPPILDANGRFPIDVGSVASFPPNYHASAVAGGTHAVTGADLDAEAFDSLQKSLFTMQFLAFAPETKSGPPRRPPSSLYFTFQFYRFPYLTTERLDVFDEHPDDPAAASAPRILYRMEGRGRSDEAGLEVRYTIDPSFMRKDEARLFATYLHGRVLHIDVWDGVSHLQVGTVAVPLRALLRQGRPGVLFTDAFPVTHTEYLAPDEGGAVDSGGPGYRTITRGMLHLRFANVGDTSDLKLDPNEVYNPTLVQGVRPVLAAADAPVAYTAKRMVDKHPDLAARLLHERNARSGSTSAAVTARNGGEDGENGRPSLSSHVRYLEDQRATRRTLAELRTDREVEVKIIDSYRASRKARDIEAHLLRRMTAVHTIFPSFGELVFFEYELTNPYAEDHVFTIEWDDAELRLVTDHEEWRHLKEVHRVRTPLERDLLAGRALKLHARETVFLPFAFQSFNAGQPSAYRWAEAISLPVGNALAPDYAPSAFAAEEAIASRTIRVNVVNDDGKNAAMLDIEVKPQPFVVDHTHRFFHTENEFLKRVLYIDPLYYVSTAAARKHGYASVVHCNRPDVHCGVTASHHQSTAPPDVFVKYECGPAPDIARFFLVLYRDRYQAVVFETWQIFVHSVHRVDIDAFLGQTTEGAIVVHGDDVSRTVQCFHTDETDVEITPDGPFLLPAHNIVEVAVSFRPMSVGKRQSYVNVVDVDKNQLVSAWQVASTARKPDVRAIKPISLHTNTAYNKTMPLTNNSRKRHQYRLRTNRPDLLRFADDVLDIAGASDGTLALQFLPNPRRETVELLIFVNDLSRDKSVDCLSLIVTYK